MLMLYIVNKSIKVHSNIQFENYVKGTPPRLRVSTMSRPLVSDFFQYTIR